MEHSVYENPSSFYYCKYFIIIGENLWPLLCYDLNSLRFIKRTMSFKPLILHRNWSPFHSALNSSLVFNCICPSTTHSRIVFATVDTVFQPHLGLEPMKSNISTRRICPKSDILPTNKKFLKLVKLKSSVLFKIVTNRRLRTSSLDGLERL